MTTRVCASVVAFLGAACGPAPETVSLVIQNVTVIDPASRQVLPDRSVFVAGDRIRAVESSRTRRFVAADTIDGTGRFLIPGLTDNHVHAGHDPELIDLSFDLMIANGVTGVRLMGADCWAPAEDDVCLDDFRAMAAEIESGERTGPRVMALASTQINGPLSRSRLPEGLPTMFSPGTADEGRALARHMDQSGVDIIKVYSWIPRAPYFGMLEEASELGIEVSGHLPAAVSAVEASDAGQRTIEHSDDLGVHCSTYAPEYLARMNDAVEGVDPTGVPWERMRDMLDGFDAALCDTVLSALADNGTYLVPTHGTRENRARADEPAYRNDPRLRYMPVWQRDWWDEDLDLVLALTPEIRALFDESYVAGLRLTGRAHSAGVRVLVGTDANSPLMIPGFAVHDELSRLGQAGVAPMDVLRAATTEPAAYYGRSEDLGGISPGRLADLVLLNEDPLADLRNTTAIEAVLVAGRVYDRAALDRLLARAEAFAVASEASGG